MSTSNMDPNTFPVQTPPSHHIHRDSEVLPGARSGAQSEDYSPGLTNDSRIRQDTNQRQSGAGMDDNAAIAGGQYESSTPISESGKNAINEKRPLNVQPTSEGGVAIDGRDDLPQGKPSLTDKLVGKTQKVTGKAMRNPELHEKGELRESGGKGAAKGEARAPHD